MKETRCPSSPLYGVFTPSILAHDTMQLTKSNVMKRLRASTLTWLAITLGDLVAESNRRARATSRGGAASQYPLIAKPLYPTSTKRVPGHQHCDVDSCCAPSNLCAANRCTIATAGALPVWMLAPQKLHNPFNLTWERYCRCQFPLPYRVCAPRLPGCTTGAMKVCRVCQC